MGYSDYLKDLLRPMRFYDVDEGSGAEELAAEGAELDGVYSALSDAEREMLPPTAQGEGLQNYEAILPYHPSYITLQDRRRAVMSLMQIDDCAFTADALNATLSGCGIKAQASETGTAYTVQVRFPDNRGIPADYDALKARIEAILPCHLQVEYYIIYITWQELEGWFSSWAEIEGKNLSWDGLERYSQ